MSKRLEILKTSLGKKNAELDRRFDAHFDSVREANGQPLNDKRNGGATLSKWEKQDDAIRAQMAEVEKTKAAIERDESKIKRVYCALTQMPDVITNLIDDGTLIQWRKHPTTLFVAGVDKARIVFKPETGSIVSRYLSGIPDAAQFAIFRDVFNDLKKSLKDQLTTGA